MRAVDEICEIFVKAATNINDEFREYTFVKLEETYTADLRLIRVRHTSTVQPHQIH